MGTLVPTKSQTSSISQSNSTATQYNLAYCVETLNDNIQHIIIIIIHIYQNLVDGNMLISYLTASKSIHRNKYVYKNIRHTYTYI